MRRSVDLLKGAQVLLGRLNHVLDGWLLVVNGLLHRMLHRQLLISHTRGSCQKQKISRETKRDVTKKKKQQQTNATPQQTFLKRIHFNTKTLL